MKWHHLMHPDSGELLAFNDGELAPNRYRRVNRHVQRCFACQAQIHRLQSDFQSFLEWEVQANRSEAVSVAEGLNRLKTTLLGPEFELANTLLLAEEDAALDRARWLSEQFSSEVQAYLGERVTSDLVNGVSHIGDPQKFIHAVRPLLEIFLGKRAAARVGSRLNEISKLSAARMPGCDFPLSQT
jgi:hypothetical protein